MFSLLILSRCETETVSLDHGINYIKKCATDRTDFHFLSPGFRGSNFIIALIKKPERDITLNYTYPIGTTPKPFNISFPSYSFPNGDAEIIASLEKDECITFAYASIRKGTCLDSLKVYVSQEDIKSIESKNVISDDCVLVAPYVNQTIRSFIATFNISVHGNNFYIYNNEMVHGNHLSFENNRTVVRKIASRKPLILRMETKFPEKKSFVLYNTTTDISDTKPLSYEGDIVTVPIAENGVLSRNFSLVVLGCALPIILLVTWTYSMIRVCRNKPTMVVSN